ncbi:hypothetical protein NQ315_016805 [Exocentrus adspersus]|uniref:Angiotensin-converting enzyme n=1 Tax=Exocentrus adspersus TaxID=1586481 RepID=A0AAV8VXC1_9CUCU|nr:hypothetical protein NQ315_016805 [Exocentrus adspersus]
MANLQVLLVLVLCPFLVHPLMDQWDDLDMEYQRIVDANYYREKVCNLVTSARVEFQLDLMNDTKMERYIRIYASALTGKDLTAGNTNQAAHEKERYILELVRLEMQMIRNYSTAKICPYRYPTCNKDTEGLTIYDIQGFMEKSKDYYALQYMWTEWMSVVGRGFKKSWIKLFEPGTGENRPIYTTQTHNKAEALWKRIEPFYDELHKYVGRKLQQRYGGWILSPSGGPIPAHILGDMWGESWHALYDLVEPFPDADDGSLQELLKTKKTVLDMYVKAHTYIHSLRLPDTQEAYKGPGHMIVKPKDRVVDCYPTTHDFCNMTSRITFCTRRNLKDLFQVYNQLGIIQYYTQFKKQKMIHGYDPQSDFHHAIGGGIALAGMTPRNLHELEWLTNYDYSKESDLNHLMMVALIKLPLLPVALSVGKWKEDVVAGLKDEDDWNSYWWQLLEKYQKIKPPVERTKDDLDAIARYQMMVSYDFRKYFFSHLLEFQIHRGLCRLPSARWCQQRDCPLHHCDLWNFRSGGLKLTWALRHELISRSEALKGLTGYDDVSAEPLMEYFEPLYQFLKEQNSIEEGQSGLEIALIVISVVTVLAGAAIGGYKLSAWYFSRTPSVEGEGAEGAPIEMTELRVARQVGQPEQGASSSGFEDYMSGDDVQQIVLQHQSRQAPAPEPAPVAGAVVAPAEVRVGRPPAPEPSSPVSGVAAAPSVVRVGRPPAPEPSSPVAPTAAAPAPVRISLTPESSPAAPAEVRVGRPRAPEPSSPVSVVAAAPSEVRVGRPRAPDPSSPVAGTAAAPAQGRISQTPESSPAVPAKVRVGRPPAPEPSSPVTDAPAAPAQGRISLTTESSPAAPAEVGVGRPPAPEPSSPAALAEGRAGQAPESSPAAPAEVRVGRPPAPEPSSPVTDASAAPNLLPQPLQKLELGDLQHQNHLLPPPLQKFELGEYLDLLPSLRKVELDKHRNLLPLPLQKVELGDLQHQNHLLRLELPPLLHEVEVDKQQNLLPLPLQKFELGDHQHQNHLLPRLPPLLHEVELDKHQNLLRAGAPLSEDERTLL